jgi:hypothetical protein
VTGGLIQLGTAMSQTNLRTSASLKVTRQVLDSTRLQGQQALKLIQAAAAPPAAADGRGSLVNTYA